MRKMKSTRFDTTINVVQHIIVKNMWEYYITDEVTDSDDIKFCLVVGDETELGDVWLEEIKPYIITDTTKLNDVLPAPNWVWID